MINYNRYLVGKQVQVVTKTFSHVGIFEAIQMVGPKKGSLFVILKIDEDRTRLIPEHLVERIDLVDESGISGQDGEGS